MRSQEPATMGAEKWEDKTSRRVQFLETSRKNLANVLVFGDNIIIFYFSF